MAKKEQLTPDKSSAQHRPEVFPEWNARIGDRVVFKPTQNESWKDGWSVTGVGFKNEHDYFLNIQITHRSGKVLVVPPRSHPDNIWIVPPAAEYAEMKPLVDFLAKYTSLMVIRNPTNGSEPRYDIVCTACDGRLRNVITEIQVASLHFWPSNLSKDFNPADELADGGSGFVEGSSDLDESGTETKCDCRSETAGDQTYDVPATDRYT